MGSDGAFANFRLAGATEKNGTLLGGPGVVRRGGCHRPLPAQPRGLSAKDNEHSGSRTFLPSHDLGGKLPIRPTGLAMPCGECGQWPSSTAWCKMLTAFRGEPIRCTRSVTVCGTSRIRTLIQTRAPRRRFFTGGGGASLVLYRIVRAGGEQRHFSRCWPEPLEPEQDHWRGRGRNSTSASTFGLEGIAL